MTLDAITRRSGDVLLLMVKFRLAEKHSGVQGSRELNQLDWISGVRMGRQGSIDDEDERSGPANLGEEVSIVGHKFPKVRFEKILVSTGELVVSLRGPLTEDNEEKRDEKRDEKPGEKRDEKREEKREEKLVFIRLVVTFPASYPYVDDVDGELARTSRRFAKLHKRNLVQFDIEETHEIAADARARMLAELARIAHFFTNVHKRFCLEPCLRYLLGDKVYLDESVMDGAHEGDADADANAWAVEVGTEGWADDLYDPSANDDSLAEEDGADLIPTVPVADEPETQTEEQAVRPIQGPIFDSTPVPKGCGATWSARGQLVCFFMPVQARDDNAHLQRLNLFQFTDGGDTRGSDSSDDDGYSDALGTSTSSLLSLAGFNDDWEDMLRDDAARRLPGFFKASVGLSKRLADGGTQLVDGPRRFASEVALNQRSSVHEHKRRLRDKRSENVVAIHDFSHLLVDRYELACEYRVLGDTPERLARYNAEVALRHGLKEISDVWRILEMVLVKDVVYEDGGGMRFYWGTHPIGHSWMIAQIFRHFEERGNLQMLAMLSCILYENANNIRPHELFRIPVNTPYLVDLGDIGREERVKFGREDRLREERIREERVEREERIGRDERIDFGERVDFERMDSSRSDSRTDFFRSDYSRSDFSRSDFSRPELRTNFSRSTFNEERHPFLGEHRNSSLLVFRRDGYAASISSNGSKEVDRFKKGDMRRKQVGEGTRRSRVRPPPVVTIEMQNADELDLYDDVYSLTLLQSQDLARIRLYREQYANMLYMWGLPINRVKILKFNFSQEVAGALLAFSVHSVRLGRRVRKRQDHSQLFINAVTPQVSATHNPWNTKKRSMYKYCVLCNLVVLRNMMVCTNCEHVLHTGCAAEWWRSDAAECPSGCGCSCLDYAT